jgi:tRNA threonylcarbamoyladenosine biosynthesis protein TsaB
MNVLVIDTATEACSVAIHTPKATFTDFAICPQEHAVNILPMVQKVLDESGLKKSELNYLGFGRGPGSFTGVRIATGIIQGLALGLDKKVVGISTLEALAQQTLSQYIADNSAQVNGSAKSPIDILCAIDARMSEVYFAHYRFAEGALTIVGHEEVLAPVEVLARLAEQHVTHTTALLAGTGWQAYADFNVAAEPSVTLPAAEFMLPAALRLITAGQALPIEDVQPEYVRDKVTWKKLPGRE